MNPGDDRDLRRRFEALRDADAANAPALERVLRGRTVPAPSPRAVWVSVAALFALAAVTAVLVMRAPLGTALSMDDAVAQAKSLSSWTAPTDDFLTLPGLEIPDSVPSLSLSSVALPEASTPATSSGEAR
jgi:hypothetical protein